MYFQQGVSLSRHQIKKQNLNDTFNLQLYFNYKHMNLSLAYFAYQSWGWVIFQ